MLQLVTCCDDPVNCCWTKGEAWVFLLCRKVSEQAAQAAAYQVQIVALLCDGLVGQHPLNRSVQFSDVGLAQADGPLVEVVLVVTAVPGFWPID